MSAAKLQPAMQQLRYIGVDLHASVEERTIHVIVMRGVHSRMEAGEVVVLLSRLSRFISQAGEVVVLLNRLSRLKFVSPQSSAHGSRPPCSCCCRLDERGHDERSQAALPGPVWGVVCHGGRSSASVAERVAPRRQRPPAAYHRYLCLG